ncbi:MAG: hypothetical protein WC242_00955 [Candidatus Paceibacterota bacterium]|jgi:hypothetical protein
MKKKITLFITLLILITIGAILIPKIPHAFCLLEGGKWASLWQTCNHKMNDGGKECTDSNQCQGRCDFGWENEGKENVVGHCANYENESDCWSLIDGKVVCGYF